MGMCLRYCRATSENSPRTSEPATTTRRSTSCSPTAVSSTLRRPSREVCLPLCRALSAAVSAARFSAGRSPSPISSAWTWAEQASISVSSSTARLRWHPKRCSADFRFSLRWWTFTRSVPAAGALRVLRRTRCVSDHRAPAQIRAPHATVGAASSRRSPMPT